MTDLGRDRRAIAVLAVAAVTVVAVALLAVALHSNPSPKHVASVAPSTTDAEGVVVAVDQTTTTDAPTTTVASSTLTRPTTTAVPTTTTTEVAPRCADDDLAFTTKTDKATYAHGETVTVTETIQNVSRHRCGYLHGVCPATVLIKDVGDNWVWASWDNGSGDPPQGCPAVGVEEDLDPGAYSATRPSGTWEQRICEGPTATTTTTTAASTYRAACTGSPAPAGQYSAWMYHSEPTKPAFFQIS
jgi:hypothetical protein